MPTCAVPAGVKTQEDHGFRLRYLIDAPIDTGAYRPTAIIGASYTDEFDSLASDASFLTNALQVAAYPLTKHPVLNRHVIDPHHLIYYKCDPLEGQPLLIGLCDAVPVDDLPDLNREKIIDRLHPQVIIVLYAGAYGRISREKVQIFTTIALSADYSELNSSGNPYVPKQKWEIVKRVY